MDKDTCFVSLIRRVRILLLVDFGAESENHFRHGILSNKTPEVSRQPTKRYEVGSPILAEKLDSSSMDSS